MHASTSASFLAELSVSSPQKIFILLSKKIFSGSKYPKNIFFNFEKGSTGKYQRYKCFVQVSKCLSIKGAEDAINKPHSFELATHAVGNMYFIADQDKVRRMLLFSKINKIFFGYFDPENIFIDNENK